MSCNHADEVVELIEKKNALVVGATTNSGIGNEIAWALIRDGYSTTMPAPRFKELDVTDETSIDNFLSNHGPFDVIVYSAGVSQLEWAKNLTKDHLDFVFDVNVFGMALLFGKHELLYPGYPVNALAVVSDASETPMRGSLAYCASKAAQVMALRVLAREMAPSWRINGISPGVVEGTDITKYIDETVPDFRNWTPEQAQAYEMSGNLLGRRVKREEVSELAMSILDGPQAYNGQIATINGGK